MISFSSFSLSYIFFLSLSLTKTHLNSLTLIFSSSLSLSHTHPHTHPHLSYTYKLFLSLPLIYTISFYITLSFSPSHVSTPSSILSPDKLTHWCVDVQLHFAFVYSLPFSISIHLLAHCPSPLTRIALLVLKHTNPSPVWSDDQIVFIIFGHFQQWKCAQ